MALKKLPAAIAPRPKSKTADEPKPAPKAKPKPKQPEPDQPMRDDVHRLLPQSSDAEQGYLSSFLIAPKEIGEMTGRKGMHRGYFHIPAHAYIFDLLYEMYEERFDIDVITLTEQLRNRKKLDFVGGPAFITDLFTRIPTAANASHYLEILEEKYTLREMIKTCNNTMALCYDQQGEVTNLLDDHAKRIQIIEERRYSETSGDTTDATFAELEAAILRRKSGSGEPLGLPTGIPAWDLALKGIFEGEMTVLAARPGVGKSAMMETIIDTQMTTGHTVLVFQKDMRPANMLGRMAARRAMVEYERFHNGLATSGELDRLAEQLAIMKQMKDRLRIYDPENLTAAGLDAIVRKEKRERGISAWYLDHFFQLKMKSRGGENLTEAATDASTQLRRCIHETKVPGVILAHLNREGGKASQPKGEHLKYCDGLLGDSDRTLLLWSQVDGKDLKVHQRQEVVLTIEKNRNGAIGDESMHFMRELMTFEQI